VNLQQREAFFRQLQLQNPAPSTELTYHSHFELLISVMLSAQSTDVAVNKATKQLFAVANTPQAILALGETRLQSYIRTIGLYNSKSRHILATCRRLIEDHSGQVPDHRQALEALPGVGRKTANVILNSAFGHPTIAVDTHIFRLGNRTGLAPGKTVREVENALMKNVPKAFQLHAHHWLILHGRYTCTARNPHCQECVVSNFCEYPKKNLPPRR